jgi:general secretion pathway protein J
VVIPALQAGLAQWERPDLDALTQLPPVGGLDFRWPGVAPDAADYLVDRKPQTRRLKLSCKSPVRGSSIRVILRGSCPCVRRQRRWLRWQSGPLRSRTELQTAWQQAARGQNRRPRELQQHGVAITGIDDWQVYYRNNSWTSPLSSATRLVARDGRRSGATSTRWRARLVLSLSAGRR